MDAHKAAIKNGINSPENKSNIYFKCLILESIQLVKYL